MVVSIQSRGPIHRYLLVPVPVECAAGASCELACAIIDDQPHPGRLTYCPAIVHVDLGAQGRQEVPQISGDSARRRKL